MPKLVIPLSDAQIKRLKSTDSGSLKFSDGGGLYLLVATGVAAAAKAAKEIGEKANEVLASTDNGQRILDGIGEAGTHVATAFGDKQAIDVIAENLRLKQEQLAQGAGTSRPTTQAGQNGSGGVLGQLIGSGEGDYNSYNQGTAGDSRNKPKIDLSNMTLAELMRRQALPKNHKDRIFAAGKYQTIPSTTKAAVSALKINPNQKFNPELQERIFAEYVTGEKRKHLQAYQAGLSNDETAAGRDLALEFASVALPKGMKTQRGRISDGTMTYYDAKGGNRATLGSPPSSETHPASNPNRVYKQVHLLAANAATTHAAPPQRLTPCCKYSQNANSHLLSKWPNNQKHFSFT